MKTVSILLSFFTLLVGVDSHNQPRIQEIKEGTILVMGWPSANGYEHIQLPRKNVIIKRGGVPNYDSVYQNEVMVTTILTKSNGTTEVVLKRTDSGKFFNRLTVIKANSENAIASEELIWP